MGTRASNQAAWSGSPSRSAVMGVRTGPGATAFTRTPWGAASTAAARVSAETAPLEAT